MGERETGRTELMEIFVITKSFPKDEIFSLTSQIRKSSRSGSANIAEAAETQVWLDYSLECGYITKDSHQKIISEYEKIIGKLVMMIYHPEKWILNN
jgi:23S rRNA-intervening sequence protein